MFGTIVTVVTFLSAVFIPGVLSVYIGGVNFPTENCNFTVDIFFRINPRMVYYSSSAYTLFFFTLDVVAMSTQR